ncbi:methyl-accepting chemotaxis protein [Paenibacillus woosongensis]|uniref:Methyl-accepting chemotaxis protein n=1 Tax=Paenibacillus woosongensis TaxID=307580 RepID=A0AA95I613_9BACL|nr:methyl-accepting chemotaxis protein [Paenibacillus woosongensis]WHX48517.1 methyl-accepting chemotaxis protein [Paenibacillus woosongensis]
MSYMLEQTGEVETRTNHLIEQAAQLREGTGSTEKIIELLSNITKQTAILSLNASIEASKAGGIPK